MARFVALGWGRRERSEQRAAAQGKADAGIPAIAVLIHLGKDSVAPRVAAVESVVGLGLNAALVSAQTHAGTDEVLSIARVDGQIQLKMREGRVGAHEHIRAHEWSRS